MFLRVKARWVVLSTVDSVCPRCLPRAQQPGSKRRLLGTTSINKQAITIGKDLHRILRRDYFSANDTLAQSEVQPVHSALRQSTSRIRNTSSPDDSVTETRAPQIFPPSHALPQISENPHRRRRRLKSELAAAVADEPLPPDAPSRLTSASATFPAASIRRLLTTCLALSKPRLSFLIVLTTAATYAIYPVPTLLLPETTAAPSLSALTLVFLTTGTALTSGSANTLNMLMEPKHDAQMSRTRNRPLVRGLISKRGALIFAVSTGLLGVGSLGFGVNPTVAFLGAFNIFLYAGVYTPMKRLSACNTWVGAVVGAVPPLMGWAAAAGQSASGSGQWQELLLMQENIGGWLVAALLFAWQFPHFNSLSWPIREEYKNAGYRMLVWTNARMNGRVALRYSLLMFPICFGLVYYDITDQGFLVTSSIVNAWMVREAWSFWWKEGFKGSARGLFWASVWHLPVVMVLAMVHKKGLWNGVWKRLVGDIDDDGDPMSDGKATASDRNATPLEIPTSAVSM